MNLIEKMNASKEKETVQYTIVELFEMLKEGVAEINQHQLEVHALGEANLNQAMMLAKKQEEIDNLKSELALCREENKGLVGKVSEQQKRVGFAFTEFEMFAGYLCEHQPQGGDFITETLLMHGRVLKALRGEHD